MFNPCTEFAETKFEVPRGTNEHLHIRSPLTFCISERGLTVSSYNFAFVFRVFHRAENADHRGSRVDFLIGMYLGNK